MVTSVKRHFANNISDPHRQNSINLFLGVYKPNPSDHKTIWDVDERELHEIGYIPELVPRWWE